MEGAEDGGRRPNFLAVDRNHDLAQSGVEWDGGGAMLVRQANTPGSAYPGWKDHGREGVTPRFRDLRS